MGLNSQTPSAVLISTSHKEFEFNLLFGILDSPLLFFFISAQFVLKIFFISHHLSSFLMYGGLDYIS